MANLVEMSKLRPGDICTVQIGRLKRRMLVITRTIVYDSKNHGAAIRLAGRRDKALRVEMSLVVPQP